MNKALSNLLKIQSFFYFLTGVWPLVHMPSFLVISGDKADLWLVRTVGGLLAISGVAFFTESRKTLISSSVIFIAMAQAAFLASIDVIYVSKEVIPPVYLLDAAAEILLLVCWSVILVKRKSPRNEGEFSLRQKVHTS